jgi:exosortase/archaeosortase family protein
VETLHGGPLFRRVGNIVARLIAATAFVWAGFSMSVDRWRSGEATVVVWFLHFVGVDSPKRVGDQILVVAGVGHTFSVNIGWWCSSLGMVLAFGAFAMIVASGDRRRRWRAFGLGAGLIVSCNLVRIAATVLVGVRFGPGSIEAFHDGVATWFAVLFVLGGFGLFVSSLAGGRGDP